MDLYTVGYLAGWDGEQLASWIERIGGTLLDIRTSPTSSHPHWRGRALQRRLRDRYQHVPELGNRNYNRPGAPIALIAPERAIALVTDVLHRGPAVLLCACPRYQRCHRSVAAEFLSRHIGDVNIRHVTPADIPQSQPPAGEQLSLFNELLPGEYPLPPNPRIELCRSCGARVVWIRTESGKSMPLSVAMARNVGGRWVATSHFADCPHAHEWRRK